MHVPCDGHGWGQLRYTHSLSRRDKIDNINSTLGGVASTNSVTDDANDEVDCERRKKVTLSMYNNNDLTASLMLQRHLVAKPSWIRRVAEQTTTHARSPATNRLGNDLQLPWRERSDLGSNRPFVYSLPSPRRTIWADSGRSYVTWRSSLFRLIIMRKKEDKMAAAVSFGR